MIKSYQVVYELQQLKWVAHVGCETLQWLESVCVWSELMMMDPIRHINKTLTLDWRPLAHQQLCSIISFAGKHILKMKDLRCCKEMSNYCCKGLVFISYSSFLWVGLWKYIQQWRSAACPRRFCPRMIYRQWEIQPKWGGKKRTLSPRRIIEVVVNMAVCPIGQDGHFTYLHCGLGLGERSNQPKWSTAFTKEEE